MTSTFAGRPRTYTFTSNNTAVVNGRAVTLKSVRAKWRTNEFSAPSISPEFDPELDDFDLQEKAVSMIVPQLGGSVTARNEEDTQLPIWMTRTLSTIPGVSEHFRV